MAVNENLVNFSEAEAQRLSKLYVEAEREIMAQINQAMAKGNQTQYLEGMMANVKAVLKDLQDGNRSWCEQAIPRVYYRGVSSADNMLQQLTGQKTPLGFGAIHQQAVKLLADNTFDRLENVVQVVGRRVSDFYRQFALEAVRQSTIGNRTVQEVARDYRAKLEASGVTGFVDKAGKNWNMKTYSEMVAQTTTMEAHLGGTENRLVEHGHDLVRVTHHGNACPLCVPFQDAILSLTGFQADDEGVGARAKDGTFCRTLEEARNHGLFHPRCGHDYGMDPATLETELEDSRKALGVVTKKAEAQKKAKATKAIEDGMTTTEVEEYLKAKYNHVKWELGGMDPMVATRTFKHFDEVLAPRYPEAVEFLKTVSTDDKAGPNWQNDKNTYAYVWGSTLCMNPKYYGSYDKLLKSVKNDVKLGFHPIGTDVVESIFHHEFGHIMHNYLEKNWKTYVLPYQRFDFVPSLRDLYQGWQDKRKLSGKLSEYGKKNKKERWAESFAAMQWTPEADQPKLVKQMRTLLDVVFPKDRKLYKDTEVQTLRYMADGPEKEKAKAALEELQRRLEL